MWRRRVLHHREGLWEAARRLSAYYQAPAVCAAEERARSKINHLFMLLHSVVLRTAMGIHAPSMQSLLGPNSLKVMQKHQSFRGLLRSITAPGVASSKYKLFSTACLEKKGGEHGGQLAYP